MGTVVVVPEAGLGNRIRTIASAYALAKQQRKRLKIIWIREAGLNCSFTELFATPHDADLLEYNSWLQTYLLTAAPRIADLLKIKKLKNYRILNNLKKIDERSLNDSENLFIKSCYRFYKYETIPLQFSSGVTQAGNQFLQARNGQFIGMHIRQGDNEIAIKRSPVALFLEAADAEITKTNKTIFLCTDDKLVKEKFISRFGERVFTRDAVLNRNTAAGIIDAAVDMYCLSQAQKIYASDNSSFSTISAQFNKVPITRLKHEEA